jgi:hypothetical protein
MNKVLSVAKVGYAVATSGLALLAWHRYGRKEPMVSILQAENRFEIILQGEAAPVKTSKIQHEGITCLKNSGFEQRTVANYDVLQSANSKSAEPHLTLTALNPYEPTDLSRQRFEEACINCQVATIVDYQDTFGFKRKRRLPWIR